MFTGRLFGGKSLAQVKRAGEAMVKAYDAVAKDRVVQEAARTEPILSLAVITHIMERDEGVPNIINFTRLYKDLPREDEILERLSGDFLKEFPAANPGHIKLPKPILYLKPSNYDKPKFIKNDPAPDLKSYKPPKPDIKHHKPILNLIKTR
jgi:hypothetical protein